MGAMEEASWRRQRTCFLQDRVEAGICVNLRTQIPLEASRSSEHCSVCHSCGGVTAAWGLPGREGCFLPEAPGVILARTPRQKMGANNTMFHPKCFLSASSLAFLPSLPLQAGSEISRRNGSGPQRKGLSTVSAVVKSTAQVLLTSRVFLWSYFTSLCFCFLLAKWGC